MENYIEKIRRVLGRKLNIGPDLLDVYALLVLVKGVNCTSKDVHDAWSVWRNRTEQNHRSLIPFDELEQNVQALDDEYKEAIQQTAIELM